MMVEAITSTPIQPIETADSPEPGFERAISHALQQDPVIDTSAKPASTSKKTSATATPRPSNDSKTDEAPTVVAPISIIAGAPIPQPLPEARPHFKSAPENTAAAIEHPSTLLCPAESSSKPQPIQVAVVSAPAVPAEDIATEAEISDSLRPQPNSQPNLPEDQHLARLENQPLPTTKREAPNVASTPRSASEPISKPSSPTKLPDSTLTSEGPTKSEDRPQNKDATPVDQPAPTADDAPRVADDKIKVPIPEPTDSPETHSKTPSDSPQIQKPSPTRPLHNPVPAQAGTSKDDSSNSLSVSLLKAEAQPRERLQHEPIHHPELSNSPNISFKPPTPAGSPTLVPAQANDPLPEPAPPATIPPERAKLPEVQLSDPPAPGAIHLLTLPEHQEMKFSWNTPDFGHIEIRTSVDHDRVGALVAAPDAALRESLRSELDSLTRALGQHSLELGDFHTSDSGTNSNSRHSHDSNTDDEIPNNRPYGSTIPAPAPYRRDAMHAGMVDLHA